MAENMDLALATKDSNMLLNTLRLRMNTARFARNVAKGDFLRDFQHCGKFSWKQDYFYTMTAMLINVAGQRF